MIVVLAAEEIGPVHCLAVLLGCAGLSLAWLLILLLGIACLIQVWLVLGCPVLGWAVLLGCPGLSLSKGGSFHDSDWLAVC